MSYPCGLRWATQSLTPMPARSFPTLSLDHLQEPSLRVPVPSMKDHYQYDPATVERPDKTQHLKKNDFSEYMEVKLRLMHHLANH